MDIAPELFPDRRPRQVAIGQGVDWESLVSSWRPLDRYPSLREVSATRLARAACMTVCDSIPSERWYVNHEEMKGGPPPTECEPVPGQTADMHL